MNTKINGFPYAHTKMAEFLSKKIDELKDVVTQREMANQLGYPQGNIISMFKSGQTKVPLEKIPDLAEALDVDIAHLMRLGLEQYWPEKLGVITEVFSRIVTTNEFALVMEIRERTHDSDPALTLRDLRHSSEFAI